jgi:tetratricopeptide (TPR) repeat protein
MQFEDAVAPAERAIRRARELGDARLLISVLRRCAYALPPREIERARALFDEALCAAQVSNDREELGRILDWWAVREAESGAFERAIELSMRGLPYASDKDKMYVEAHVASWYLCMGRVGEAAPHARRLLEMALDSQHPLATAFGIAWCAAAHAERSPREAAMLCGYAKARIKDLDWKLQADDERAFEQVTRVIAGALTQGERAELAGRGADLQQDEALRMLLPELTGDGERVYPPLAARNRVGTLLI